MNHSDRAGAPVRSLSGLVLPLAGALVLSACANTGDDQTASPTDDCRGAVEGAGGCADGDDAGGGGAGGSRLSEPHDSKGKVEVTLHPGPGAAIGRPTVVTFGAPFPPGALVDAGQLAAFDEDGAELEIHSAEILPWRAWPGTGGASPSVRSALVSVQVTFADETPLAITLAYGEEPHATLAGQEKADPRADWVAVTDGEYPDGTVREPPVYATFPPEWLGDCQLRTRTTAAGSDPDWAWFDDSMIGSAHTAVNDVPGSVKELVPFASDAEPWLFDRSATLFGVYVRTGDVEWLRRAHRAAQFYAAHIDGDGYFDLVGDDDLKYSYGRSLVMDYQLTGDPALVDATVRVAAAGAEWDPTYDLDTSFWTERHQTYALLAALSAWEATGEDRYADRAREVAEDSFAMAADPAGSWHADGCLLHGMTAHEGAGGDEPICSPWMSALFADAVWEYFIHTADPAALDFLAGLAHYVADDGLYGGGDGLDLTMPWYLASSVKTFSDDGPYGDVEHTCDVAGLVARGAWAEKQQGGDPGELRAVAEKLLEGCKWDLESWHRPDAPALGKSEWRLSPPRKFSWWFGTTSDLPWLMEESA
ncbi:MAG TPA: hypothetical protein VKB80_12170 [Kofleriaceae bacterium]|nr:hypothetical protein [Kofleriaceae bacterium]